MVFHVLYNKYFACSKPEGDTWIVSPKDAMTMYRLCLHETGVFGSSQWCNLLSEEDQKALEYYLDMKTYWKRGNLLHVLMCSIIIINLISMYVKSMTCDDSVMLK